MLLPFRDTSDDGKTHALVLSISSFIELIIEGDLRFIAP